MNEQEAIESIEKITTEADVLENGLVGGSENA